MCRKYDYCEHDGRLHQFGCPRTHARDNPKCADGPKHEASGKDESEVERASFQSLSNHCCLLEHLREDDLSICTTLMPLPEPASKQDQFASDEEHSKSEFVVLG